MPDFCHRIGTKAFLTALSREERHFVTSAVARVLCEKKGHIISVGELCAAVWHGAKEPDYARISVAISIRTLRKAGLRIEANRTLGYCHPQ